MTTEQPFNIWVPLEAYEKSGDLRIRGVISTEDRDKEGEIVLQDGLDFTEFLKDGYINDNHSKDTAKGAVLGFPLKVSKGKTQNGVKCSILEGKLYKEFEPARQVHHLAKAMQTEPENSRRLGFSLQGGIISRAGPKRIPKKRPDGTVELVGDIVTKAVVRHVAVTHCPVNPKTQMEALIKSLQAGGAVEAPAASPGEGFPLRQESLDGKKKKKRGRRDAVEWLMKTKGISRAAAEKVWELSSIRQERNNGKA